MRLGPVLLALLALAGCGKGGDASAQAKDPYAGMSTPQKIEALRNDPKLNSMERESKIAELQKQAN